MRISFVILLGGWMVFGGPASADEPQWTTGVMNSECAKLTSRMTDATTPSNDPLALAMMSWAEGYLSSLNIQLGGKGDDLFDLSSLTAAEMWAALYGYCRRNPEKPGVFGIIELQGKFARFKKH